MAHGKSLVLKAITGPTPTFIHEHAATGIFGTPSNTPYVNPDRDTKPGARLRIATPSVETFAPSRPPRTRLSGAARRRARSADRAAYVAKRIDGAA